MFNSCQIEMNICYWKYVYLIANLCEDVKATKQLLYINPQHDAKRVLSGCYLNYKINII